MGLIKALSETFRGTSVNYNWILKNGTIMTIAGAETGPSNRATKQITTTFDSNKYKNASDLDI